MEKNPILIVDDDDDDIELIKMAAKHLQLKNDIHYFKSGNELYEFLKNHEPPFLILSDVNLPSQDGFEIRKMVLEDKVLRYKSVPFIFWSTAASEKQIQHAYDLPAQGFFFKPSNFEELCSTLKTIIEYWQKSQHPKRL